MYLDVFIGEIDVPGFSWEKSDADGEYGAVEPRLVSDGFPESHDDFLELRDRMEDGRYVTKPIDWGTWAAKVSKQEIIEFLRNQYGDDIMEEESAYIKSQDYCKVDVKTMKGLITLVRQLDDNETYALVARES